jgi:positive regulator of sigma E activity
MAHPYYTVQGTFFNSIGGTVGVLFRKELKYGTVTDTSSNIITVVLDILCEPMKGCSTGCGACGGNHKNQKTTLTIDSEHHFTVGQKVTIHRTILNENIAAGVVFGIPILFSLLCIGVWILFSPSTVDSPWVIFSTVISFIAGFPVVRIIDKLFNRNHPPSIVHDTSPVPEGITH